jgi:hypothetical protein
MNQHQILYQWCKEIARNFHNLSKPQGFVLTAFSLGMALAKSCNIRAVAEELYALGKPDTVERRLQYFLSNKKFCWKQSCQDLASWVISSLMSNDLIVLLVDETSLKDKMKVMAVSLAYRKRAIPLAWWCYPNDEWPMGQVELIKTLFNWISHAIPKGARVLVEADRGIGCSPNLLKAIQAMGWYYLVRVTGNVHLILQDGKEVCFSSLVPSIGQSWSAEVYAFKKAGWLKCWAVGQWKPHYDEAWLLLTNLPEAEGDWYAIRMWQELAFKDFKSTGWQWQRSHVWKPEHANILWLVMSLAYVWVISMGSHVISNMQFRVELTRGNPNKGFRKSVFQLGLSFLKRWVDLGRELIYELLLIPHFSAFQKSLV